MTIAQKKIQRVFQGVVVSDKMAKTIVVKVDSMKWHKKYKTQYRVSKKFKVHDEKGQAKTGNVVLFVGTRPISKEKRWRLAKIVK